MKPILGDFEAERFWENYFETIFLCNLQFCSNFTVHWIDVQCKEVHKNIKNNRIPELFTLKTTKGSFNKN